MSLSQRIHRLWRFVPFLRKEGCHFPFSDEDIFYRGLNLGNAKTIYEVLTRYSKMSEWIHNAKPLINPPLTLNSRDWTVSVNGSLFSSASFESAILMAMSKFPDYIRDLPSSSSG